MPKSKLVLVAAMAVAITVAATVTPAQAYIGPGAGAGTIAVVLGILASLAMAFFAVLWYPIKRVVRRRRVAKTAGNANPTDESGPTS